MSDWKKEEPTMELQFVLEHYQSSLWPYAPKVRSVLQQKWKVTYGIFGQVKEREEWRNVPCAEEKKQ
jgi:hypothetical protein